MLLKRIVKGDVAIGIYKSSNILVSEYDQSKNELTVVFKNGGKYAYSSVPKSDAVRFEMAESQGKVLNSHIKQYPFIHIGKVDTNEYLVSIQEAETERLQEYQGIIISAVKDMVSDWDKDKTFLDSKLDKLKDLIKSYEDYKG